MLVDKRFSCSLPCQDRATGELAYLSERDVRGVLLLLTSPSGSEAIGYRERGNSGFP